MDNVTHIIPRDFGLVADLRWKFPNHVAVPVIKRGVILMLPRVAANHEFPKAA